MKVLVTGGKGFIGTHTVHALAQAGHEPVSFDRSWAWPGEDAVEGIVGDIRDATAVTEAVAHVQGVIHLAGVLGTQETITNPIPAAETNLLGMLNVLQACTQYQVPLVNIGVGNYFENNTYSITKDCSDRFTEMYRKYRGQPVTTVRVFNAYGPGQSVAVPYGTSRVRKVMPSFICRALHGETIQYYGDGSQIMDMVYVEDVAQVLVRSLELTAQGTQLKGVEGGTGRRTSILQVAEVVADEVDKQAGPLAKLEQLPLRPGETPGVVVLADTSGLAQIGMDASRFTTLEDGVAKTVAYYRQVFGK